MKAKELATTLLDALAEPEENLSIEIAEYAELLAKHVLALEVDETIQLAVDVGVLGAMQHTTNRFDALLNECGVKTPAERLYVEAQLDRLIAGRPAFVAPLVVLPGGRKH